MPPTYNLKIVIEIHVITCPGVWLCQNDDIELSITTLGYKFKAIPLPPRFPLCYHEKFFVDGYFSDVHDISELEKALNEEPIVFTLWQKGRRLAYYSSNIGVVLNYTGCLSTNFASTDNAIIMTKSGCFPGTISPKIEYTASTQCIRRCFNCHDTHRGGRKRFLKNLYENRTKLNESFLHSKPVCHSKLKPRYKIPKIIHNNIRNIEDWNELWLHTSFNRWHLDGTSSWRNCNTDENESILCDYCSDTFSKDNGNHALYSRSDDKNPCNSVVSLNNSNSMNTMTVGGKHICDHAEWNRQHDSESVHSRDECTICLKYRTLFGVCPIDSKDF